MVVSSVCRRIESFEAQEDEINSDGSEIVLG